MARGGPSDWGLYVGLTTLHRKKKNRKDELNKRVEFLSDRISYIILGGRWYHVIVRSCPKRG
jgi:hypothetical protein